MQTKPPPQQWFYPQNARTYNAFLVLHHCVTSSLAWSLGVKHMKRCTLYLSQMSRNEYKSDLKCFGTKLSVPSKIKKWWSKSKLGCTESNLVRLPPGWFVHCWDKNSQNKSTSLPASKHWVMKIQTQASLKSLMASKIILVFMLPVTHPWSKDSMSSHIGPLRKSITALSRRRSHCSHPPPLFQQGHSNRHLTASKSYCVYVFVCVCVSTWIILKSSSHIDPGSTNNTNSSSHHHPTTAETSQLSVVSFRSSRVVEHQNKAPCSTPCWWLALQSCHYNCHQNGSLPTEAARYSGQSIRVYSPFNPSFRFR